MTEEIKFIRKVCPRCSHETRTPNNFWNVIKFWKYETVEEAHTDLMECIVHLNKRIAEASRYKVGHSVCHHCPHCAKNRRYPSATPIAGPIPTDM